MIVEVKINELPESVAEGTLVLWHKAPGEAVKANEPLAEIETDKVVLEIAATATGVLVEQKLPKGQTVKRGMVIATIDSQDANAPAKAPANAPAKAPAPPAKAPAPPAPKATASKPAPVATAPVAAPAPVLPPEPAAASVPSAETEPLAPAVRKLLEEHGLSVGDITGTGRGGRITKEDVIRYLEHSPQVTQRIGEAPTEVQVSTVVAPPAANPLANRAEKRVKMTRLRARIAERMLEAQRTAAILTTFNEVNMQAVTTLRQNYRDVFQKQHGIKLGFMGFFVKACAEALKRYPIVNASVDGDEIVYHGYFDLGVAVSTSRGLVVPVLRNVDKMSLAEIERTIAAMGQKGEEGKLSIEDLTGGTFTISNGGVFGSMLSTPILNAPQSAILGLHKVENRPVADGQNVVVRPMMYLALSYDHRIIDGRDAVLFLSAVKELIEDPTRFLLQA
jgi:2-oxoglutarate dehydrogenase E2 component (dihydrolipoamide succinyltransferase)